MNEKGDRSEWAIDTLPNRLTIFRLILIPVIIACLLLNLASYPWLLKYQAKLNWAAGWIFVLASITDFFDGHIARRRKIVTVLGSFLDPIADKFLVVSSLILLLGLHRLPVLIVIILVLREMYMTALRLLAIERDIVIPVNQMGKIKTTFQMIGIPMLMANQNPYGIPMIFIGKLSIYFASIISLYSAAQYSINLVRKLKLQRLEKRKAKREQN